MTRLFIFSLFALSACGGGGQKEAPVAANWSGPVPSFWLAPTHVSLDGSVAFGLPEGTRDLFTLPGLWEESRSKCAVVMLQAGNVRQSEKFVTGVVVPFLRWHGIRLALECGGATWTRYGDVFADLREKDLALIRRLVGVDAPLSHVVMDSPLVEPWGGALDWIRAHGATRPFSFDDAISDVVSFADEVRAVAPRAKIGVTDPVCSRANGRLAPDAVSAMRSLMLRVDLDFVQADTPRDDAVWQDVKRMGDECARFGVEFQVILNDTGAGERSASDFVASVPLAASECAGAGCLPGAFVVQSWFPHPQKAAGDDDPEALSHALLEVERWAR